jgi:hypothetical protein
MIDDDECGAVSGIKIGRGNQSTQKTCPSATWSELTGLCNGGSVFCEVGTQFLYIISMNIRLQRVNDDDMMDDCTYVILVVPIV